jgi:predicted membrane protein
VTSLWICSSQNKLTVLIYIIFASVLLYQLLASVKQILKWLLVIMLVVVYFQYSQCYYPLSCELLLHLTLFILVCCINLSYITKCYIDIMSVRNSVAFKSRTLSMSQSTPLRTRQLKNQRLLGGSEKCSNVGTESLRKCRHGTGLARTSTVSSCHIRSKLLSPLTGALTPTSGNSHSEKK